MLMTMKIFFLMIILMFNFILFKKVYFISNFLFFLGFLFLMNLNFFVDWVNISMLMSVNYYSFGLILLSFWIMGLVMMTMASEKKIDFGISMMLLMSIVLIFNFLSLNVLLFYLMFEISLIIIFLLIVKWGLGIMRLSAGYYLMFYTLFFSLPLVIILFYLMNNLGTEIFLLMEFFIYLMKNFNNMMILYLLLAFLVKLPMFMFHNWLLKAHVEAPVYGSMILAALMLKLGSYGLLRFIMIFYYNMMNFNLLIFLSIIGGIVLSLLCFRQIDMKVLVAMSSIVHMNLLLSSMMTLFKLGILGSYMLMIAHGLCSSAMFYMLNLCYIETNSRMLIFNKGLMIFSPSMTLMWFLICSSNMSAPMSLNLVGEIMMLISILIWSEMLLMFLFLYCLLSFMYSLYFFSYINHGNMNFNLNMKSMKLNNYLILLFHWIPLNMIILNLDFLM